MSATPKKEKKKASPREAWGVFTGSRPVDGRRATPARTDDDKALTFQTNTDARTWLSSVHTKTALGRWEIPEVLVTHRRAEAEAARTIGFTEYADRWIEMIRTQPNRSGKMCSEGTIRSYKGKVTRYLVSEFDDTPIRNPGDVEGKDASLHNLPRRVNPHREPQTPGQKVCSSKQQTRLDDDCLGSHRDYAFIEPHRSQTKKKIDRHEKVRFS